MLRVLSLLSVRFRQFEPVAETDNPLVFWQVKCTDLKHSWSQVQGNQEEFPLMSRYWGTYASFQATSVSAERIFNR